MLSACGGIPSPASSPSNLDSTNGLALAAESAPFAYVAQICRTTSSCPSPSGLVQMLGGPSITTGIENPTTLALDGSGNLYVGNETTSSAGGISVYAAKSVNPLRTLSGLTGVPRGLVANASGRLFAVTQYLSGCCDMEGAGAVYAPGASQPTQLLQGLSGFAHSPVLDKSGNLYVGNFDVYPGWVSVYGKGQDAPSRLISTGIGLPIQLTIAPDGDLVIVNGLFDHRSNVVVYPAGASAPSMTIVAGLSSPTSVAVDAAGNIYVANDGGKRSRGTITIYRRGQTKLWRTIRSGVDLPAALAFDKSGRLYVANVPREGTNSIAVFGAGGSKPVHTYVLTQQFAALAAPH
jgi:hypothetical protein